MATRYSADDLKLLKGLEAVRKRPGMYIGGVSSSGLHHLAWEVLDNCVDEAMNGHASDIVMTLHADGHTLTVSDNGRGIPVDKHRETGKSGLELVFTELHAGGKFDNDGTGNYKTSGGLHGVGASVVNALSKSLIVTVKRDGDEYRMDFARGNPVTKLLKKKGETRGGKFGTGTTVTFTPDPQIFPKTDFDPDTLKQRLEIVSFIHKGVKVTFIDDVRNEKTSFQHENGLSDYLNSVLKERNARPIHEKAFVLERDQGMRIETVFQWTESTDEHVRSYVNGIPTGSGGSHESGLKQGVNKAVRNYIDTHDLTPRGVKITPDDIREGLVCIVSTFVPDPQFQGQTKDKLNNPEVLTAVDNAVRPALEQWLNANPSVAEQIVARIIIASRARAASRAASDAVSRKSPTSGRLTLPGKLADCTGSGRSDSELFIVEGDSAGGSAKQGRSRTNQAILPLRGKVLNTEDVDLSKVLANKELSDLVTAMGCGIGKDFDLTKLRYQRIILLADADSDGHHITTLLLTFFYRHLRRLIEEGHLYIAMPPLYRIDVGKDTTHWAADDADRDRILKELNGRSKPEITRFKGLGEMMPKVLWQTTLNPATRRLQRVDITDALEADRVMNDLMGKDPSARFRFIMERAEEAEALDV